MGNCIVHNYYRIITVSVLAPGNIIFVNADSPRWLRLLAYTVYYICYFLQWDMAWWNIGEMW